MMECTVIQKHFSEYIDDRLAKNLKAVVDEHLETCQTCKKELEEFKRVVGQVRELPREEAPGNLLAQLNQRLEPPSGFKQILAYLFTPFRYKIPFGFATATALAVVIIFMVQMKPPFKSLTEPITTLPSEKKFEPFTESEKTTSDVSKSTGSAPRPSAIREPLSTASPEGVSTEMRQQTSKAERGMKALETVSAPQIEMERENLNIVHWELAVGLSKENGLSENFALKSGKAGQSGAADIGAGILSMERAVSVTGMKGEDLGADEDEKQPHSFMDEVYGRVEALTDRLGGEIVSVEEKQAPDVEKMVIISIPVEKLEDLYNELVRMGRFKVKHQNVMEDLEGFMTVQLRLIPM